MTPENWFKRSHSRRIVLAVAITGACSTFLWPTETHGQTTSALGSPCDQPGSGGTVLIPETLLSGVYARLNETRYITALVREIATKSIETENRRGNVRDRVDGRQARLSGSGKCVYSALEFLEDIRAALSRSGVDPGAYGFGNADLRKLVPKRGTAARSGRSIDLKNLPPRWHVRKLANGTQPDRSKNGIVYFTGCAGTRGHVAILSEGLYFDNHTRPGGGRTPAFQESWLGCRPFLQLWNEAWSADDSNVKR